ncbi:MAG TPA: TRAP transporter small permease [Clostridia bacterium]|jgi:TRAP-type C4-dicarboxylate transport system permease small subunit|nr:TRAP transporter small permease [Clostridia bacterium]
MTSKSNHLKGANILEKSKYLTSISMIVLVGIILLIVVHVLLRGFFGAPLKITYDYISCFTVVAISLAMVEATYERGHAVVGFILERFPIKFQKYVDLITSLLVLIVFSLFAYSMILRTYDMYIIGDTTMGVQTPLFPFMGVMTISFIMVVLVLLYQLLEHIINFSRK